MVRSTIKAGLASALLAVALAACGGGGGGSSLPATPTTGGSTSSTTRAALKSGFATSTTTSGAFRLTKALASTIQPVADFIVPDAYVSYKPFLVTSATAVAYYDTSNGGVVPLPLPTGTWSASGIPVSTSGVQFGANLLAIPSSVSSEQVAQPSTTGKALLTFTSTLGDSTTLTAYSYGGTALDDGYSGGYAGTKPCVTFSSTASAQATPGTSGDLCIITNADKTTSVVAQYGAIVVAKPIDQVTLADAASLPSTSTTLGTAQFSTSYGQDTIIAKTASGAVVKYQPVAVSCGCQGGGTPQGYVDYLFGYYRVTPSGTTAWDE